MKIQNSAITMLLVAALSSIVGCADGREQDPWANLDGAIAAYKMAVEWNLESAKAYNNLSIALLAKGDIDGAIAAHNKALEVSSEFSVADKNLCIARLALRDLDGAIVAQRKAIEMRPE